MTRFGHGCWAMRSMRLALAASTQWRSSIDEHGRAAPRRRRRRGRRRRRPRSSPVTGRARPARRRRRAGVPIEPGWAVAPSVDGARRQRLDELTHEARLADARPRPDTSATAGWSPVITSAASTMPARRANGRARPTMTGLIPTRPLSTVVDARGAPATATPGAVRRRGGPSAPGRVRRGSPAAEPVRRHAGRDRLVACSSGEVGGARGRRMGAGEASVVVATAKQSARCRSRRMASSSAEPDGGLLGVHGRLW